MSNITNFPNGVSSWGVPALPYNSLIHVGSTTQSDTSNIKVETHWWVNGNFGSDGNSGQAPDAPRLTMASIFTDSEFSSGDIIHMTGNITEQLTTPAGIFDVTIIGEGNLPRNADSFDTNNGFTAATWKYPSSPTAATPLLKIQQQGWRLVNILFSGSLANTPDVLLFRDGGAGDSERDASHAHIVGCRFDGGVTAIQDSGGCAFVQIVGNMFRGFSGDAINNVTGAGIGTLLCWNIENNRFALNDNHIDLPLSNGVIRGNVFGAFTTTSVTLDGGTGSNVVTLNYLFGTYQNPEYVAGTADEWGANMNSTAGGWTAADPA